MAFSSSDARRDVNQRLEPENLALSCVSLSAVFLSDGTISNSFLEINSEDHLKSKNLTLFD